MSKKTMLKLLEEFDFPKSRRNNIQRGKEEQRGFALGKIGARGDGLIYDKRRERDSVKTNVPKYQEIYKEAKKLMRRHNPNFKFTTIQFNKNNRTAKHKDGYNVGESYMIGLGDYNGGDLLIYDKDGKNPKKYKTRNKWIKFNGSIYPHETAPFSGGNRYTLVFFNR